MRGFAITFFSLATLLISGAAHASCDILTGRYQLPEAGRCGSKERPFSFPLNAAEISAAGPDATIEITQSGCEKIRFSLKIKSAQPRIDDFDIPSEARSAADVRPAVRRQVSWDSGLFGSGALEIVHSYRSREYEGGAYNHRVGPVRKSWLFSIKKNRDLDVFETLDYSSFHKPYRQDCVFKRVGD